MGFGLRVVWCCVLCYGVLWGGVGWGVVCYGMGHGRVGRSGVGCIVWAWWLKQLSSTLHITFWCIYP